MTERIFVSYAHEDRDLAKDVERELRRNGLVTEERVLILDPQKEIQVGDNVRDVIRDQMMSATTVVIIASESSARSHWVNYEAGMASALGKPVVLMVEPGMSDVPFVTTLDNVQSIDIQKGKRITRTSPLVDGKEKNVTSTLRVYTSTHGQSKLVSLLKTNGIEYRPRQPIPGEVRAATDFFELINVIDWLAVAAVFCTWLRGRESRHVKVTTKEGTVVDVKGGDSIDKVVKLLEIADSVAAIQTTEDDDEAF